MIKSKISAYLERQDMLDRYGIKFKVTNMNFIFANIQTLKKAKKIIYGTKKG